MKNVLITGAAGFIGLNFVNELLDNKYNVYALIEKDDEISRIKLQRLKSSVNIIDDFEYLLDNVSQYPKFNFIFHLASVGVIPGKIDISKMCDVNIRMGCELIDFSKKNGTELFVNFGSCFEYGDHGNVLLKEDMSCIPESLYAITKNSASNIISAYAKSMNVKMITVRPFGVFGDGEGPTRLAPSIIKSCMEGKAIDTTFGEQVRDFVNVKDLVKAILMLSESDYTTYEIYNICSNNPVKVKDFILEIIDVCGFNKELINFGALPYRENEAMIFAGDNQKLQKVINYPFPKNHKAGILDIYNSIKEMEKK